MSRGKRIISAVIAFAFALSLISIPVVGESKNVKVLGEWGEILNRYAGMPPTYADEDLYAVGNSITVTKREVEQATDFFVRASDDYDTARAKAIDSAMKREALYAAAVKNGYTVTEEEIWEYLDGLKEFISGATNKDDVQAVIDAFPSEEDYWNYEFTVYQKNLPIEKYADHLRKVYYEQLNSEGAEGDYNLLWKEYYEEFQEQLVEEQEFQIVDQINQTK